MSENEYRTRPNIFLMGVAASGTTIVTRILGELGWNIAGPLNENYEHTDVIQMQRGCVSVHGHHRGDVPANRVAAILADIRDQQPWVIKNVSFPKTINEWVEPSREYDPLLVWLTRDPQRVELSWKKRERIGGMAVAKQAVRRWQTLAPQTFEKWPLRKVHFEYEQIREACRLFDVRD